MIMMLILKVRTMFIMLIMIIMLIMKVKNETLKVDIFWRVEVEGGLVSS